MAESVIERCTEQVSNRFKLALLASQRTHDLNIGASSPVQAAKFKGHKNTIISLYEIAEKQVDIHELFSLLVGRCKEYMKGSMSNVYSGGTSKLEKLLNFSDGHFNIDSDADQESTDTQDSEVESEIDDQDSEEIDDEEVNDEE
ncbi:DNA-directed RNA polymerase subunit omega [Wolbachia endosymbiont of Ctenocephalides felis wCfeJ]|uniref:DNA-directed RNA polymerase subunit omega n=1 Tax=Wolbachia endosymbiont of Ctenocephalides felis wCfeJ TaxID=2732594 RepID=UPI00144516CE|nr:DNA-directed RNA polymerase subunit omega [Wolbachia endosymbiont of Ctenocephalides felis wCfeJ]WCR57769.1 MAG: DNA-directed RNA polymerase subunit omega [Wolbachia endosymbiont of Ctenocephalides felis wCfeJ]